MGTVRDANSWKRILRTFPFKAQTSEGPWKVANPLWTFPGKRIPTLEGIRCCAVQPQAGGVRIACPLLCVPLWPPTEQCPGPPGPFGWVTTVNRAVPLSKRVVIRQKVGFRGRFHIERPLVCLTCLGLTLHVLLPSSLLALIIKHTFFFGTQTYLL